VIALSMSVLPRANVCPASVTLPQQSYESEYADQGTERHAALELAVVNRDYDQLPDEVAALLADYAPTSTYAELTMFYDFVNDTARSAERRSNRVDRYASATPYEISGPPTSSPSTEHADVASSSTGRAGRKSARLR
jgi:hypothetical protein